MREVRLASIGGVALRTFAEPFFVNLPASGVVLVEGVNEETGGGSGAGKSNLGMATAYTMGYGGLPATSLQSWDVEGGLEGAVGLVVDGKAVEVRRGPGKLAVGSLVKGSMAHREEKLRELLGADPKLMGPLVHRKQRERGAFLSLADDEARELLAAPLGIDRIDTESEAAGKRAGQLEVEATQVREERIRHEAFLEASPRPDVSRFREEKQRTATARLEAWQAQAASDLELQALKKLTDKQFQNDVAELAARRADLEAALAVLPPTIPSVIPPELLAEHARLATLEQGLVAREAQAAATAGARQRAHRAARDAVQAQVQRAAAARAQVPLLETEIAGLMRHDELLKVGDCPTCARPWPESVEAERARLRVRVEELQNRLAFLVVDAPDLVAWDAVHPDVPEPLLARCAEARACLGELRTELARRVAAATVEDARQNGVRMERAATLRAQLAALPAMLPRTEPPELTAARMTQHQKATEETRRVEEFQNATAQLAAAEEAELAWAARHEALVGVRAREAELARRIAAERDLETLLRTFLGKAVAEVLVEVSSEVNRLLAGVANVRHLTFALRTEATSARGRSRTAITPVVEVRGREAAGRAAIRDTISGGQLAALELAVDLAVLRVVERQLGVRWRWLWLDEVFEGLGPVETETALEMLRTIAADRVVLITAHNVEVQGLFDAKITVRYRDGRSTIA